MISGSVRLEFSPLATPHHLRSTVLQNASFAWDQTRGTAWWDLYVVDGIIAGVHRATNFLLFDIVADVALPCEEHEFISGVGLSFTALP